MRNLPCGLDIDSRCGDLSTILIEGDVRQEDVHPRHLEEVVLEHLDELSLRLGFDGEVLKEAKVHPQPGHRRDVTEVDLLTLELFDDFFNAFLNLKLVKREIIK